MATLYPIVELTALTVIQTVNAKYSFILLLVILRFYLNKAVIKIHYHK